MYYNKKGEEISLEEWSGMLINFEKDIRVGLTDVDQYQVSTVNLCITYHVDETGKPLGLFETMVFGPGDDLGYLTQRYNTFEQAKAGHEDVVNAVRVMNAVGAAKEV